VIDAQLPDLVVGLIRVRDAHGRSAEEGAEIVSYVAELTAIVHNRGDALADETTTRFWVRGADVDKELRVIYTPVVPPGEEIEVTALWDIRGRRGEYVITVTADACRGVEDEQAWRRVRGQAIAPTSSSFSRKPSMVTGVARSRQRLLHARIVLHHLNSWIACRRVPGTKVLLAGDQWQWRPPPQASIIGSVGGWPVRGGAG
jgi:CARDB